MSDVVQLTTDGGVLTLTVTGQDTLTVAPAVTSVVELTYGTGPKGDPGPTGPSGVNAQPRWSGAGPPPAVIVGANPGDGYLDLSTGDTYQLT